MFYFLLHQLGLIPIGEFFFLEFPKFGNNWIYVSRYAGVVTIREILQQRKNQKVTFHMFGKKYQENLEDKFFARKKHGIYGKKALR